MTGGEVVSVLSVFVLGGLVFFLVVFVGCVAGLGSDGITCALSAAGNSATDTKKYIEIGV